MRKACVMVLALLLAVCGCQLSPPDRPEGPDELLLGQAGQYKSEGHGPKKYHHWDWYLNGVQVRDDDDYKESFAFEKIGADLVCRGKLVVAAVVLPVQVALTCTEACPLYVFWTDQSKPKLITVRQDE